MCKSDKIISTLLTLFVIAKVGSWIFGYFKLVDKLEQVQEEDVLGIPDRIHDALSSL